MPSPSLIHKPLPSSPSPSASSTNSTITHPPAVPSKPPGLQASLLHTSSVPSAGTEAVEQSSSSPSGMTFLGPPISTPIINANSSADSAGPASVSPTTGTGSSPKVRSPGLLNASYTMPKDIKQGRDLTDAIGPAGGVQRSYNSSPTPSSNGSFHTPMGSLSGSPNTQVPSNFSPNVGMSGTGSSTPSNYSGSIGRGSISRKGSAPPTIGITTSSPPHSGSPYTAPFPSNSNSPTTNSHANQVWGAPPPLPTRRPNPLAEHGRKSSISRGIQQIAGGLGFFGGGRSGSSATLSAKASSTTSGGSSDVDSIPNGENRIGGRRSSSPRVANVSVLGSSSGSGNGPLRWMPRRGSGSSVGSNSAKVEVGLGLGLGSSAGTTSRNGNPPPSLPPRQEQTETLLSPDHPADRSRSPSPRRDRLSSHASLNDGMGLGVPPLPARAMATAAIPLRGKSEDTPRTATISGLSPANRATLVPPTATRRTVEHHAGPSYSSGTKADKGRELLGSAVSTGWSAFNKAKSKGGQAISNLREQRAAGGFGGTGPGDSSGSAAESTSSGGRPAGDGPYLAPGVMKRRGNRVGAQVFGIDAGEASGRWRCEYTETDTKDWDEDNRARMSVLPAVAVRCVDYLMLWTPDEEGIFRVSGRSSHIALLRKTFDTGGDLDLTTCDPGDIDPHAVASLYKSYLRELPSPILTSDLAPQFDTLILEYTGVRAQEDDFGAKVANLQLRDADARVQGSRIAVDHSQENSRELMHRVSDLIAKLPNAHRYLLKDLARLLAWTSSHSPVNKMTLQNLLMVFCPSISLSPPFMKLLVEHHERIFAIRPVGHGQAHAQTSSDGSVAISGSTPSLSTEPSLTSSLRSIPRDLPREETPQVEEVVPAKPDPKYSTPIADRFARTGPITLSLRDPAATPVA